FSLRARDTVVGDERGGKARPQEQTRKGGIDFVALDQEVDRRPADEIAVEAAGGHLREGEPAERTVIETGGGAGRPAFRTAAPDREHRGGAAPPGRDHFGQELRRLL